MFVSHDVLLSDKRIVFTVVGSTGRVYHVTMTFRRSGCYTRCSCPDHTMRKRTCKHMYFVILRVLQQDDVENTTLLFDDAVELLEENQVDLVREGVRGSREVRDAVEDALVAHISRLSVGTSTVSVVKREDLRNTSCGFCLEDFDGDGEEADVLGSCYHCHNGWHEACQALWKQTVGRDKAGTCIFCRSSVLVTAEEDEVEEYARVVV